MRKKSMVTFWHKLRISDAWNFKAPIIFGSLYVVITQNPVNGYFPLLILSAFTIIGIAGIGYLSNDWGDRNMDRKAGKPNFFNTKNIPYQVFTTIIIGFLAFLPWTLLPSDRVSWGLIALELITFFLYALPPFRLKKSKWEAPIFDALYAHVIPTTLAAYTFMLHVSVINLNLLIFLAIWQMMLGIRLFINHLIADRSNDLYNYPTLATSYDFQSWHLFLKIWASIEFLFFLLLVASYTPLWLIIIIIAISTLYVIAGQLQYSFRQNDIEIIYLKYWPLLLVISISLQNQWYILLLIVHLLFFKPFLSTFENNWLIKKLRKFSSYFVNHLIYWVRRIVLNQSDKTARRQYFDQYMLEKNNQLKRQNGTITIVNLHKDKYSETFIHHYKSELPFSVDFLHGGYPPCYDENNNLLIENKYTSFFSRHYWNNTSSALETKLILSICQRIRQTKSKLILAHFGPMAVSMLPIVKVTGIPMVVYFHAYDIHHRQQLNQYKEKYSELFKIAHLLIGSSQDVINKLIELGAAPAKTRYLPAFLPVNKYLELQRNPKPNTVLAVGRFTPTKSPEILILAFAEVVKILPQAVLYMIGDGELMESCINLARALRIEKNIQFMGIQPPEVVRQMMANSQVFVQHSATTPINHDKEGTPIAILEALAAAMPIVSTSHAGIQEIITHNQNGLLVKELDYHQMAVEIIYCLQNEAQSLLLGENARDSIKNNPLIMNHMEIMTEIINTYGLTS